MKEFANVNSESHTRFRQGGFLISLVLSLWLLCCALYLPRVIHMGAASDFATGLPVALILGLFFMLFWLFGSYHLVVFAASRFLRQQAKGRISLPPEVNSGGQWPRVAVLYPTMNDFDETAIRSCLNQDYPYSYVFILDDSTDSEIRAEIDHFALKHTGKLTVVRRVERKGFKAGNLNYALAGPAAGYSLIAVVDADCVLPADFIRRLLPVLIKDRKAAFVQACCQARRDKNSLLAEMMSPSVNILWDNYMPYRNQFGFIPFMGHGALLRREAWEDVGGFPEVVAEDIAFALAIREKGYYGKYVDEPVCYEALPPTYNSFRGQQAKYIKGACEFLWLYWRHLLSSRQLRWFEKLDLGLLLISNLLPGVFFIFTIFVAFIVPLIYYDVRLLNLSLGSHDLPLWPVFTPRPEFNEILTTDFYVISIVSIIAPIIGTLGTEKMGLRKRLRFLSWCTTMHLALVPQSFLELVSFIVTRRAEFFVTGSRAASIGPGSVRPASQKALSSLNLISGIAFVICSASTLNLYLASIGVAIFIGMAIKLSPTNQIQRRSLSALVSLPFLLMILSIFLLGFGLLTAQGSMVMLGPFHF